MNFEEHAAKPLLAAHGISVPASQLALTPDEAASAAADIGPCVVKAQVPIGKRGKAGGIKLAATPDEARAHAEDILKLTIGGYPVERLLIEAQTPIKHEYYAAVLCDPATRGPVLLFSTMGGMDVEEATEKDPDAMKRIPIDITQGADANAIDQALSAADLGVAHDAVIETLVRLYDAFRALDAELLEINPLVVTDADEVIALDCKYTLDDSAAPRHPDIAAQATPEKLTGLEAEAAEADLKYIELGGSVGVIANGAGLTMTSMDAVTHYGGQPCNFLEIGGEAYTKAETALTILLKNPNIKSLLVNFCGAFARTDVMAGGICEAWKALNPDIPIFFTIHGTGEEEAIELVKRELGLDPYDLMDDAVRAAVEAAA